MARPKRRRSHLRKNLTLRDIAYHEAGHAVVAWKTGRTVHGVNIIRKGSRRGFTRVKPLLPRLSISERQASHQARRWMEEEAMAYMAGPIAEGLSKPRLTDIYAHGDDFKSGSLYIRALATVNNRTNEQETLRLAKRTQTLLRHMWPKVLAVAEELLENREISAKRLKRVLNG